MLNLVPTRMFLTKGVGRHKYRLKSFEEALRDAGVAQQNLVQVSSILPPLTAGLSAETKDSNSSSPEPSASASWLAAIPMNTAV